jgi:hypothetical protein
MTINELRGQSLIFDGCHIAHGRSRRCLVRLEDLRSICWVGSRYSGDRRHHCGYDCRCRCRWWNWISHGWRFSTRGWLSSLWLRRFDPLRVSAWPGAKAASSVVVVLLVELEDTGFDLFELPLRVRCHHRESLDLILKTLDSFFILVDFFNATHSGL